MLIYKKYFFDTAHYMPNYPKDHKYGKIHGHSYEIIIYINGTVSEESGLVVDFEKLDELVEPLIKIIDHNTLNNIKGLENPTSENLAKWFWISLKKSLVQLQKIEINIPRIGGCVYFGEDQ